MVVAIKRSTELGRQWRSRAPRQARPNAGQRRAQRMLAMQHALRGEPARVKPSVTLPKLKFLDETEM